MAHDDMYDDRPDSPATRSKLPKILAIVFGSLLLVCGGGGFALYSYVGSIREKVSSNNLKQAGLAIHNYHDTNGMLPANTYAPDGTPLLSWRVHILPYLEYDNLYRQFHLNEPWDSPHNRPLLDRLPLVYATAGQRSGRAVFGNKTFYRAFASPGAIMEPPAARANRDRNGMTFASVTDGLSNTVFVVEAGEAVEWSKPDDLTWDAGQPMPTFGADRGGGTFLALIGDGSVKPVRKTITPEQLKAAITYKGGESVKLD